MLRLEVDGKIVSKDKCKIFVDRITNEIHFESSVVCHKTFRLLVSGKAIGIGQVFKPIPIKMKRDNARQIIDFLDEHKRGRDMKDFWIFVCVTGLIIGLMVFCIVQYENHQQQALGIKDAQSPWIREFIYDECEYVIYSNINGEVGMTHKGNCKLCRKRLRAER